jgi:hypothetical protein
MRKPKIRLTRSGAIVQLREQLERDSFPRLQMGLIVALTGGSGLLASFLMMKAGVDSMALRYPLALLAAYTFFLLLLWLWLRTSVDDYVDGADAADLVDLGDGLSLGGRAVPDLPAVGGGDFAGGGAQASFDAAADGVGGGVGESLGKAAGSVFDADELVIPLLVVLLALGLALASLYIVYMAPALFAELLFDGVLSFTLYRHLRRQDASHWLGTAVRRTALPFGLTAVFLCGVGAAMAAYAPGARSVGEVIAHASKPASD